MKKISKIEKSIPTIKKRKRVAAYARVSVEKERTLNSLSSQISFYNELIQKNPEWEFAGVYADSGISGTTTNKRDEFQRLLKDSEDGKIDIILTKSISRFARNTLDLLETVRHLKDIGVEVRFEKERINSFSGDGELMLSILASFAQEEVISLSNNVKWATKRKFAEGIPNGKFRILGYRWKDDKLVIEPKEACIVRRIYQNFIDGKSRLETEREFEVEGIKTINGCNFKDSQIKQILTNITYTGNLLFQKEFVEDPLTHKRKKNRGELPMYYVENTHEAIIDKETFDLIQEEMARRKSLGALANKSLNITCFTGKIKCKHCGCSFVRSIRKSRNKFINDDNLKNITWICNTKKKKGGRCSLKEIPDIILKRSSAEVLGLEEFDEKVFKEKIQKIDVEENGVMVFNFYDKNVVRKEWKSTAKKDNWTQERRNLWGEYNHNGGKKKLNMGFNEYIKWKEENGCGKEGNNNSSND